MPSPKLPPIELSTEERRELARWEQEPKARSGPVVRAQIVLRCAAGESIGEVAEALGVSRDTASKWRARFILHRMDGLADGPRPGRPRVITDEQVHLVLNLTLETPPPAGQHNWSTRSMAQAAGLSQTAVSRIWRSIGYNPRQGVPLGAPTSGISATGPAATAACDTTVDSTAYTASPSFSG